MGVAKKPWSRVHVDYAGPFLGSMFLVIVHAHSKWIEVYNTGQASTSLVTVCKLRQAFVQHGLPDAVVSDNEPCFTSRVFSESMRQNGIQHIKVAPYHPASNGLAERAVQTFKAGVKKMIVGTLEDRISRFLFAYQTTPHIITGVSPGELLMVRNLKTRLDLVRPGLEERVIDSQARQEEGHDRTARDRVLQAGDTIYARNHSKGATWIPAKIVDATGPLSFRCQLADQRIVRKHQDQIRRREPPTAVQKQEAKAGNPDQGTRSEKEDVEAPPDPNKRPQPETIQPDDQPTGTTAGEVQLRRSNRVIRPPDRLDLCSK
ncbi:uncharacterized protein K02A2.6-like [Corticium candelabrum]|uniref:uncharacterized protein K02A2.6-like n=1 Tax=Corticium candelabrum TaxID=121492 RepID=UPI002E273C58|nr:uncharacterized protein K02A2.6-like [Corticium candelabrum]